MNKKALDKIMVARLMRLNKWIRDEEHAMKILNEIKKNRASGNYFSIQL